jgi:hypothetical protein
MTAPPLQWSIDTKAVSHGNPAAFAFEASGAERDALKVYAGIEDLASFQSEVRVTTAGSGRFRVTGVLRSSLVQSSVIDLEAVRTRIEEKFAVEYWPAEDIPDAAADGSADADPPEALVLGRIPIGELLCEHFLVAIDPYPRNEGDNFQWEPPRPEPETSPFAELARFKVQKDSSAD